MRNSPEERQAALEALEPGWYRTTTGQLYEKREDGLLYVGERGMAPSLIAKNRNIGPVACQMVEVVEQEQEQEQEQQEEEAPPPAKPAGKKKATKRKASKKKATTAAKTKTEDKDPDDPETDAPDEPDNEDA